MRRHNGSARILVVDDQDTQRLLAVESLRRGGFDVLEVDSGAAALSLLREHDVAAMVVDVMMPEMDGFELCKRVRSTAAGRQLPIMVMTARDDESAIEEAYDAGATDFVAKPVNPLILIHRMRYMLRGAATLEELRRNETLLDIAEDVSLSGSWEWSYAQHTLRSSRGFATLFERNAAENWPLQAFLKCFPDVIAERIAALAQSSSDQGLPVTLQHAHTRCDGTVRHLETRIDKRTDLTDQPVLCGVTQDVTLRRAAEREIRKLAYFDTLTTLPNRALFVEHVRHLIEDSTRSSERFALLHVDIDDFKRINELTDRSAGDRILVEISKRIGNTLRACDLVTRSGDADCFDLSSVDDQSYARLGGDEFIVAAAKLGEDAAADAVCRRILAAIQSPYMLDGRSFELSACAGIAVFPEHGKDVETLLLNADSAVSEAKKHGRNHVQIYSRTIHERVLARLSLANDLRRAVDANELEVHYQPRVNIHRNQIVGMEALVRWNRDGRPIPPDQFVPIAEESELISDLGRFVLRRACMHLAALREEGFPELELGVNVSAKQLGNPALLDEFDKILTDTRTAPSSICLELTESALMQDATHNADLLQVFREMGCKIAVDDFGTGYSSLNYLKRFPIDTLKIDRSFVVDLETSHDDSNIVTAVVRLAQTLGLTVVAEGVETKSQERVLRRLGCDEVQGYLYSRPLDYQAFAKWLRNRLAVSTVLRAAPQSAS